MGISREEIPWSSIDEGFDPDWRVFARSASDSKGPMTQFLVAMQLLDEIGASWERVEPGVVLDALNARLRPHGLMFGPDPASINAAMMGGVLANNSSGMCCGVELNAYHTLESVLFVLPDGTVACEAQMSLADVPEQLLASTNPKLLNWKID